MRFRKGTMDQGIFYAVYANNEYKMGEFTKNDVVVDIGAHMGCASMRAISNGAGMVFAFEPDVGNYNLLMENMRDDIASERLITFRKAVTGSGIMPKCFSGYSIIGKTENTGGGNVFSDHGAEVESISISDVIKMGKRAGGMIRFIKMDCEGSEWPILFDDTAKWDDVIEIAGEYHEYDEAPFEIAGKRKFMVEDLIERLRILGYTVSVHEVEGTNMGSFSARRND